MYRKSTCSSGPCGTQGSPGGTPVLVQDLNNTNNINDTPNTPDPNAVNYTHCQICLSCPCKTKPTKSTNTQRVFIKTTVANEGNGNDKKVANPPNANNVNATTPTNVCNPKRIPSKQVELYVKYLESEV